MILLSNTAHTDIRHEFNDSNDTNKGIKKKYYSTLSGVLGVYQLHIRWPKRDAPTS